MLERKVIHVSGHVRSTLDVFKLMTGLSATTYEGTVKDVASGVLAECRRQGYKVRTRLTWSLEGEIREVHATVTSKGNVNMWHVFTSASDQWRVLRDE